MEWDEKLSFKSRCKFCAAVFKMKANRAANKNINPPIQVMIRIQFQNFKLLQMKYPLQFPHSTAFRQRGGFRSQAETRMEM